MWYYIFLAIAAFVFFVFVTLFMFILPKHESNKTKIDKIYEDKHRDKIERERRWNQLVDHYMQYACDLVPYDDPDYAVKVLEMAEGLANTEMELDDEMAMQDEIHNSTVEVKSETAELPL